MANPAVVEEIKKELGVESEGPLGKVLWEKKLKEGPGSTPRTKYLYKRCRWYNAIGGEYARDEIKCGIERMRLFTEAHKATAGQPEIIRRAKCLENYLKKCSIFIQDDELIVGDHCEYPDTVEPYPESGYFPTIDLVESDLMPDELRDEAREIAEYWRPYGLQARCEPYLNPKEAAATEAAYAWVICETPPFVANYFNMVPPYQSVLEDGLEKRVKWCEEQVQKALDKMSEHPWNAPEKLPLIDKIDVWRAMAISGKAVIMWAKRYARLAKIIAENFDLSDSTVGAEKRKKELLEISEICDRVPAQPARGFKDAMQSKWFCYQVAQCIERYASGYSHLEDRLMWPYYKASVIDKTAQPMTREEAIELVECERLKICERGVAKGRVYRTAQPGVNDLHIITIGGLDENGNDACTDLTDVILEAALNIHTNEPSLGFRYSPKINEKTRRLVYECIAQGYGFPACFHDEKKTKTSIEYYGFPKDEAAHWALVLCMAPGVSKRRSTQKSRTEGGGAPINAAKAMELTLFNGFDHHFMNKQITPQTGDATKFKTFEELFDAFAKQARYIIHLFFRYRDICRLAEKRWFESPFVALMDDYCVEEGKGAFDNMQWPNPWSDPVAAMAPADDLAAIKYWIYDKKKYTMEQLLEALKADWEGYEEMRKDFLAAPKFGNDDDYVDEIARRVFNLYADIFAEVTQFCGKAPLITPQSVSLFSVLAPMVGAEPFGKKAGEVLHDGGSSPYVGMDKKGPTAVLKSMSKLPQERCKGVQLNQRLPVTLMRESEKGFDIWTSYMKTWHDFNIDHVQFNVVRSEDMRAAQKEPEKWQHLIVRIAGYSARFVTLPKNAQDAIIARTEQPL